MKKYAQIIQMWNRQYSLCVTLNTKDRNLLCWADSGIRHTLLKGQPKGFNYSKGAASRLTHLRDCRGPPSGFWDQGGTGLSGKLPAGDLGPQPSHQGEQTAVCLPHASQGPSLMRVKHKQSRQALHMFICPLSFLPSARTQGTGDVSVSVCMQIAAAD